VQEANLMSSIEFTVLDLVVHSRFEKMDSGPTMNTSTRSMAIGEMLRRATKNKPV
jgi:hypothetical protein